MDKEGKLSFFQHCAQCFTYPSPFHFYFPPLQFYYFPSSIFFYTLAHNFNIFPFSIFFIPSSNILLFSLTPWGVQFWRNCHKPRSLFKFLLPSTKVAFTTVLLPGRLVIVLGKYRITMYRHVLAVLYGMARPNSLVRNFKNFKIVLSELSPNLAMILVPDFFLTRLVGTIYRLEGLNKRLI